MVSEKSSQNIVRRVGLPLLLGAAFGAAAVGGVIAAVANKDHMFANTCKVTDPRTPETPSLMESIMCDRPYRLIPHHDLPMHP